MRGDLQSPNAAHLHFMTSVYLFCAGVCCSAHVQRSGQPASAASDKKVRWSGLGASAFCLLSQLRSTV